MIGLHVARILKADYSYVPKQLIFAGCRPLHVRAPASDCRLSWPPLFNQNSQLDPFFPHLPPALQHWGWPMNYYRENDDDMIQSMVDCGGTSCIGHARPCRNMLFF